MTATGAVRLHLCSAECGQGSTFGTADVTPGAAPYCVSEVGGQPPSKVLASPGENHS